ncbi:MAG: DUF3458 domain-containing protein, partial [Candidatus Thioglobus sp.]
FSRWYSQSGTPKVNISTHYDPNTHIFTATLKQADERFFPLAFALLDKSGNELQSGVLTVSDKCQNFVFEGIKTRPTPSWLCGFSAPIKLTDDLNFTQKILLLKHDKDSFSRWNNAEQLWLSLLLTPEKIAEKSLFDAFKSIISSNCEPALLAELLTIPSERALHNQQNIIDVFAASEARKTVVEKIRARFAPLLLELYQSLNAKNNSHSLSKTAVGERSLKNICLFYLPKNEGLELANKQFQTVGCMSDKLSAFEILINSENPYRQAALADFYQEFKADTQVMDKYFAVQAGSDVCDIKMVKTLMQHELFTFNNPNRLRSVVGTFCQNYVNFHNQKGYELLTDVVLKLNKSNPQIGARLVANYNEWQRFSPELKALQKQQLEKIIATKNLSKDIFEITQAALK